MIMKHTSPEVVTGDPRKEPATFSRFVLPFPYCPQPGLIEPAQATYAEAGLDDWLHSPQTATGTQNDLPSDDREGRDYLTRETGEVLHKRGRWLVLRNAPKIEFELRSRDGIKVKVVGEPPALVLFEWPEGAVSSSRPIREEDAEDALRMGFLIVDLHFESGVEATLEDLMRLN